MGQKTNPIGNRLGIIRGWDSNWWGGRDYGDKIAEDDKIRKYIYARLSRASVSSIIIERTLKLIIITITTARPGIIIGKAGRYIDETNAMDHVAGYACYNDATVRDWQKHTSQFIPGKNFHKTGGFGPYMLSADEVSNYKEMKIQTRLNGEIMQDASLNDLIFPIEKLINYCSTFIELSPGDVIVTGTPGGVGDRRDPPVYMKDGDVIEIEISHLGVLKNIVHKEN